ncbi:hypothetical protein HS125_21130 [bacterium]|nr:hypothetical protein [bacterium]MBE7561311.1 hypothetical protein [bacterium]
MRRLNSHGSGDDLGHPILVCARTSRAGMALVGALVILLFVSVTAVVLMSVSQDELARARGRLDRKRAEDAAYSAVSRMMARIEREGAIPTEPLLGEISGMTFECRVEAVSRERYLEISPQLPASLLRMTAAAGTSVRAPAGRVEFLPVARVVALVDGGARPPVILHYGYAE